MADQTYVFIVFALVPKKRLIRKRWLFHLKNTPHLSMAFVQHSYRFNAGKGRVSGKYNQRPARHGVFETNGAADAPGSLSWLA